MRGHFMKMIWIIIHQTHDCVTLIFYIAFKSGLDFELTHITILLEGNPMVFEIIFYCFYLLCAEQVPLNTTKRGRCLAWLVVLASRMLGLCSGPANQKTWTQIRNHERKSENTNANQKTRTLICVCVFWFAFVVSNLRSWFLICCCVLHFRATVLSPCFLTPSSAVLSIKPWRPKKNNYTKEELCWIWRDTGSQKHEHIHV